MDSGKQNPFISPEAIYDALENLVRLTPEPSPNALYFLLLVDLYVTTNPHLPPTTQQRQFALSNVIASLVTEQYARQRDVLGLPPPDTKAKLQDALVVIGLEGQASSSELLVWSWLYHHYIRVDLGVSHQQFCDAAHIDQRTLRRYQQHGIHRLTERLVESEGQARKEQNKRWFYSQLPGVAFVPLVGRDKLVHQAGEWLRDFKPPHILVTGPIGIGKSAFTGTVVKKQVDAEQLDQLIWIERPPSIEFVRQYIREHILPEQSKLSLREYGLLQNIIVVLDGIETLQKSHNQLESLLDELNTARVLMTSSIYSAFPHCSHIALPELLREDLYKLLDQLADSKTELFYEERLAAIWDKVGGNPMAATLMFRHWPFYQVETLDLDGLFARSYAELESRLKHSWLLFALLPTRLITVERMKTIWPTRIDETSLEYLLTHHLLELTKDEKHLQCSITSAGRRFIENHYRSDSEMHELISELLVEFQAKAGSDTNQVFDIAEHILLSDWLQPINDVREGWLASFMKEGLQRGHYAEWRVLLESYAQSDAVSHLRFQIAYGVCLRHLSQWEQAQSIFAKVMRDAGTVGLFLDQAQAALEWAVLYRHQGQYTRALELLSHVELTLAHQADEKLLYDLRLEQAQIALDTHNLDALDDLLTQLPETPHAFMIRCETYLLKGNYHELHNLSRHLETIVQDEPYYLARIHALLGQSYEHQNDLPNAYRHFCMALTLLERQNDLFALARVQSNVGAVMIQQGAYHDARVLLEHAERTQTELHDQTGLSATRHNIRLLTRKVVR